MVSVEVLLRDSLRYEYLTSSSSRRRPPPPAKNMSSCMMSLVPVFMSVRFTTAFSPGSCFAFVEEVMLNGNCSLSEIERIENDERFGFSIVKSERGTTNDLDSRLYGPVTSSPERFKFVRRNERDVEPRQYYWNGRFRVLRPARSGF